MTHPDLTAWIGRQTTAEDIITPRLIASFRATLAPHLADFPPETAPLGLHWCLAPEIVDTPDLGPDGHPPRGDFLPPVPLPNRMWAGGTLTFLAPLRQGDIIRRHSTVRDIRWTHGRSGPLCFVTVRHALENAQGPVLIEDHTIAYRGPSASPAASPAIGPITAPPHTQPGDRQIALDPVRLFRYSALTFNGHRIHYDTPYAQDIEHYPGLVIHGPLQATLLLNLAATRCQPRAFTYRALRPATGSQQMRAMITATTDTGLSLALCDATGQITMQATARW